MTKREINRLIEEYGDELYSFCCHLTGNRMEADDLYQETFLKTYELHTKLRKEANPKSYMMGIAVRIWKNQKKVQENRQRIVPLQEYRDEKVKNISGKNETPEDMVLQKELQAIIKESVKQLPEKLRIVMYLHYAAGLSVKEMAAMLDVPEGTIKRRMYTGREQVKKYLEGQDYGRESNG